MKKFLLRILSFVLFFLAISTCCYIILIHSLYARPNYHEINQNNTIVVFGDSHTEAAFDASLVEGITNLSMRAETLFFTYYKIRRVLEVNQHIDHAIVSFSYHSLNEFQDKKFINLLGNYHWLLDLEGYVSNQLEPKILKIIAEDTASRLYKWFTSTIKGNKFTLVEGGYRKLDWHYVTEDVINKRIRHHFVHESNNAQQAHSTLQLKYLYKILDLCKEKNITLTLLNTPLHPDYLAKVLDTSKSRFQRIIEDILAKYPDVYYLNFEDLVENKNYFSDADHLNFEGSKVFTENLFKCLILF